MASASAAEGHARHVTYNTEIFNTTGVLPQEQREGLLPTTLLVLLWVAHWAGT